MIWAASVLTLQRTLPLTAFGTHDYLHYQLCLGTQTISVHTDRTVGAAEEDIELPPDWLRLFPGTTTIEQVEKGVISA